jgi:flavorubredoxin
MGVSAMRAVIVYESMYGNTHEIADAIGAGLKPSFDVSVVPVSEAARRFSLTPTWWWQEARRTPTA